MLGHVFYTATHFGLYNNMLLYGEKKKVPFHVSIELMIGLGQGCRRPARGLA